MAQTAPTAIDALPTNPATSRPTTFEAEMDAYLAALPTHRTQTNAISTVNYNNAVDCYNNAVIAVNAAALATAANFDYQFTFDTTTTMGDPGTGKMRFNNATPSSATAIAFDATSADSGNPDVSAFIATWGASTNPIRGYLTFRKVGTPGTYLTFSIGADVTNNTGWLQATVTYVAGSGSLSNSDTLVVQFSRAGDAGTTNTATDIHASTGKTTPADADEIGLLDSAASYVLKKLTWANLKATVLAYILGVVNTWTKAQVGGVTALTSSSAHIAIDLSLTNNFSHTFTESTTLDNPSNAAAGQGGQIAFTQHASSAKTLAFGSQWVCASGSSNPAMSTTVGAVNLLSYYVVDSTHIWFSLSQHGAT